MMFSIPSTQYDMRWAWVFSCIDIIIIIRLCGWCSLPYTHVRRTSIACHRLIIMRAIYAIPLAIMCGDLWQSAIKAKGN